MANAEFATFLKQKKEREAPRGQVDWEQRKATWLDKIDELFRNIEAWLAPYKGIEGGEPLLGYITKSKKIHEELLGSYSVPTIEIQMGSEVVALVPRATIILGGFGRIDMTGPLGSVMVVLSDTNEPPTIQFKVLLGDRILPHPASKDAEPTIEEQIRNSSWYFVPPNQRRTMLLVTEKSFTDMLMNMVRR